MDGHIHQTYDYNALDPYLGGNTSLGKIAFDPDAHFYVSDVRFTLGSSNSGVRFHHGAVPIEDEVVLPSGNLLAIVSEIQLAEISPAGGIVRTINPGPSFSFAGLRGVEYDKVHDWIYVSQLGASAPDAPQGIARLDGTSGLFINNVVTLEPNDLWFTYEGRVVAGARNLAPQMFSGDLQFIRGFQGPAKGFVTSIIPEPSSLALLLGGVGSLSLWIGRRAWQNRIMRRG